MVMISWTEQYTAGLLNNASPSVSRFLFAKLSQRTAAASLQLSVRSDV